MATQQQLEYVAVDVTDAAVRLLDSGVVDAAHPESVPMLAINEPAIRLFHLSGPVRHAATGNKKGSLPFGRVIDLIVELPRAVQTFLSHSALPKAKASGKKRFLIQVGKGGGVVELEAALRSEIDLLQTWARSAKEEDVLLEVVSAADRLSDMTQQLVAAADKQLAHVTMGLIAKTAVRAPASDASAQPMPRDTAGAAARRQALIDSGWFDSPGVARELGSRSTSNSGQIASTLRKRGKLLGVWVPAEKGFRHPQFQFHDHRLLPVMEKLLALLPKGNGSGWSQAQWLTSPHALLDKRTPAELLATDPDRVLAVAMDEYGEAAHARW